MRVISKRSGIRCMAVLLAVSASAGAYAQQTPPDPNIVVVGTPLGPLTKGPEIKGVISARHGDRMKVSTADGNSTIIAITETTRIRSSAGLFSGSRRKIGSDQLINGLPVTIKTLQAADAPAGELVASQISFRNSDMRVAGMIRNGTAQGFEEQTAATAALRGRVGDIDQYNVKATTNVHFDVGRTDLSAEDKAQLCSTASQASSTDNALLLVVGYTDSTGGDDLNQELSEKRAARVINYLQQQCGWKPYRMLTPAGMAKADPAAPNDTPEGKAQNRRVAVNILVSKAVDGL